MEEQPPVEGVSPLHVAAIYKDGSIEPECKFCHLDTSEGFFKSITDVVSVTVASDERLIVAVPLAAWHRELAKRFLPRRALVKPVCVEVPAFLRESGEETVIRVWVGFLHGEVLIHSKAGESDDAEALRFVDDQNRAADPVTQSLADVANDHFGFYSAVSQDEEEEERVPECPRDSPSQLADRVTGLEEQLESIRNLLGDLPSKLKGETSRPSALKQPTSKAAAAPKYTSLDPGVLASARQAGVPEEHLKRLAKLAQKPNRMEDAPFRPSRRNVLSESEDEMEVAEEEEADGGGSPSTPVEKAVVQLSKLVSAMAKQKKVSSGLGGILDRSEGVAVGESSSSSSQGARSKSAAFLKLKAALVERPQWIYESIEELMEEDFGHLRSAPSSHQIVASARGWLEHRSRLGHFPGTVRFAWILAGALDNLRQGDVHQARARLCLALAAVDQAAIDQGNWSLAQEVLLEAAAPMGSFQNRRVDNTEQVATKLLDERFVDLMLWRIKDRDSYIEARKRLALNARARAPVVDPKAAAPKVTPKVKAKARNQPAGDAAGSDQ